MSDILDWLVDLMHLIGAPGVGLATALETVFPPIPSEVVLPLAGYTASLGHYSMLAAVLWATVGSLVGGWVLYWAGSTLGLQRLCAIADRMPLVHATDVVRASEWFTRHGRWAVFVGRLVPGVRSLISIPAGVNRMPMATFTAYTALGSLLWNGLLIGAGYELGEQWHYIEGHVGSISNVLYAGIALFAVVFAVRRLRPAAAEGSDPN